MSNSDYGYDTPKQWRDAAMQRPDSIERATSEQRALQAAEHNQQHEISDPELLLDQQLYIRGKMDIQEYEAYLLFKHSQKR